MLTLARHSTQYFRPWLIAAMAILLLVSILEAGHAHGIVGEQDEHCILCQQTVALDKSLINCSLWVMPLLLTVWAFSRFTHATPSSTPQFTQIRAPPVKPQH